MALMHGQDGEPHCWPIKATMIAGPLVLAALVGLGTGWLVHQSALAASAVQVARVEEQRDEIIRRLERIEAKIDKLEGR